MNYNLKFNNTNLTNKNIILLNKFYENKLNIDIKYKLLNKNLFLKKIALLNLSIRLILTLTSKTLLTIFLILNIN